MSYSTDFLNKEVLVKIDRPLGSKHPKNDTFIYEQNYGYIEGVMAPDGEDLDVYVLGITKPIQEFTGTCIAVIHRTNDDDDKLIVVRTGAQYTDEQIRAMTDFQEKYFQSIIIRDNVAI